MDIEIHEAAQNTRLICNGNATVDTISQTREVVIEALHNAQSLIIDVGGIQKVDISFLQLLISTEKSAAAGRKTVEIDPGSYCEPLVKASILSGFWREAELSSASQQSVIASYNSRVIPEEANG